MWANLPPWLKAASKIAALLVPIFAVIAGFGPAYHAAINAMPFATHEEVDGLKLTQNGTRGLVIDQGTTQARDTIARIDNAILQWSIELARTADEVQKQMISAQIRALDEQRKDAVRRLDELVSRQ